jgi:hypothetical protein
MLLTLQLARIDVIVLDTVAWLDHVDVLETTDALEQLELVLGGQGNRDAVGIDEIWSKEEGRQRAICDVGRSSRT